MANWRDKYRNPSPPPGYVYPEPIIELDEKYQIFYGVRSRFFHLLLESGILEDPDPASDFDFDAPTSDEEEVVILPVVKEPPPVIDLESEEEDSSEGMLLSSESSDASMPTNQLASRNLSSKDSATKDSIQSKDAPREITQPKATSREASQHKAISRDTTQHKTAPREITQHKAASRETTQHKAASSETTQHKTASRETTQYKAAYQDSTYPKVTSKVSTHKTTSSRDSIHHKAASKDSTHHRPESRDSTHHRSDPRDSTHLRSESRDAAHRISESRDLTHRTSEARDSAHRISESRDITHRTSESRDSTHHKPESRGSTQHKVASRDSAHHKATSRDSVHSKAAAKDLLHVSPTKDSSEHDLLSKESTQKDKSGTQLVSFPEPSTEERVVRLSHSVKEKVNVKDDYSSDDSNYSSRPKKKIIKDKKKRRSNSPSNSADEDSEYEDKKHIIKHEYKYYDHPVKQESSNLYGSWYCETCKVVMNSEGTYLSHIHGKRHLKELNKQNITKAISDSVNPAAVKSRYPLPSTTVNRVRTQDIAKSQAAIEENVTTPCPGLDKVIEIQGIAETTYYCELCDAPCTTNSIIAHLTGHKHQLRCLKFYDPETYERFRYKKKQEIEKPLMKILRDIQKRVGLGKLTVEREYFGKLEKDAAGRSDPVHRRREDMPGPSRIDPEDAFPECYDRTTVPDTSKNDFYCKTCDAHMNNQNMWESHIRGKRHLTNLKKPQGEGPSKTKSILRPDARPFILDDLNQVEEPVVGLKYIRETQNPELTGAQYNCFLCGACMTHIDVIDHIISQKHRTKYLEAIDHPEMQVLKQLQFQESRMYSIIEEICAREEETVGRGHVEVYITKNSVMGGARW